MTPMTTLLSVNLAGPAGLAPAAGEAAGAAPGAAAGAAAGAAVGLAAGAAAGLLASVGLAAGAAVGAGWAPGLQAAISSSACPASANRSIFCIIVPPCSPAKLRAIFGHDSPHGEPQPYRGIVEQ